jgi:hypothetical protein
LCFLFSPRFGNLLFRFSRSFPVRIRTPSNSLNKLHFANQSPN